MTRTRTLRRLAPGAALLLAGGVALLGAELARDGVAIRGLGPDRPVNAGAAQAGDITAHNSPTVVRNPRDAANLAVASRIDSPDYSCALHVSTDGGARWSRTRVPVPAGEGRKCFAPDAAFGPDGTLHVAYVTLRGAANTPGATWVASSRDGGRTLSAPRRAGGPRAFQVRIAADPGDARRLYLTWVQALDVGQLKFPAPGNPIVASRSGDGGETWSRPVRVNPAGRARALAPAPAIGRAGELYVLYLDLGEDRLDYEGGHEGVGGPPYPGRFTLVLARSRDRGQTWEESVVDDGVVPVMRFVPFLPQFPSLGVDRSDGSIHAAFHDARHGDADVWVWTLEAGARGWSDPVRVNDTAVRDGSAQYLPQLAVAPGGRVDVVYYDRRGDPRNRRNEVSLQSSGDGGRSFGAHATLSTQPFDSRVGPGSERGLADLGSRLGLDSRQERATAVWTDTRAGTDVSNKQDLVAASVAVSAGDGGGVRGLRIAALVLALAGLAALLAGVRRSGLW